MALTKISTAGVKDDAVTSGKIPANAVGSSEIADNAVTSNELANNSVGDSHIIDGTITNTEISGSAAIAGSKLADDSISLAKLEHGTSSNDGKFLRANNGADPSFETVTSTTINGNTDHNVITGTGTTNTLQGESTFTHNPSTYDTKIQHNVNTSADLIIQNDNSGTAAGARITLQSGSNSNTGPQFGIICGSDNWYLQTPKTAGALDFHKNGTRTFRLRGDGNVDIVDGDLVIGTSGHGISFGATANGGTGTPSELFDDYEEGSWTPAIEGLSNTPSFHNLGGNYTKIGNRVFLQCHIQVNGSNKPTFTNQGSIFKISGLPFTGDNSGAGGGYFSAHGVCVWQQLQWVGGSYSSYGHGDDTQLSPGLADSGTRITLNTCGQGIYYTGQLLNRALHNNYAPNIEFDMWYKTAT